MKCWLTLGYLTFRRRKLSARVVRRNLALTESSMPQVEALDTVVVRSWSGRWDICKLLPGQMCKIGKQKVAADSMIGLTYGQYFEIKERKVVPLDGIPDEECSTESFDDLHEASKGDNRAVTVGSVKEQEMLSRQRSELKSLTGNDPRMYVDAVIQQRLATDSRTQFSAEKYKMKKLKKFMHMAQVLECCGSTLARVYFSKKPLKVGHLREDTLGLLLNLADIAAGANLCVFENFMNFVTAIAADRIRGAGMILRIHAEPTFSPGVLSHFRWIEKQKTQIIPLRLDDVDVCLQVQGPALSAISCSVAAELAESGASTRRPVLFPLPYVTAGNFDSLIIASDMDPRPLVERLWSLLAPSGCCAIYSPWYEPLNEIACELFRSKKAIRIAIFDSFLREHQILPLRTHPLMTLQPSSGFILCAVKVLPLA